MNISLLPLQSISQCILNLSLILLKSVFDPFFGIRKISNNNGVNMSFTIGCDPELVLRKNGKFVSASNYYKKNASFGLDGCNSIAELRPGYSESPIG